MKRFGYRTIPWLNANISMRDGEKIYHLPFDQVDRTKIKPTTGEKYGWRFGRGG